MKIFSFLILIIGLLTMSGLNISFIKEQNASDKIAESYFKDFRLFQKEVLELERMAKDTETEEDIPALRTQFIETRYAYKKIEFLFDYLQTSYNYLFINGGPFPKISEESDDLIAPNGLQTIDESLFSDEAATQITSIKKLANELKK